jgi:hypothetical protein
MRLSSLLAAAFIAMAPAAAFAGDQDFALVNSTGYPIDKVFVSQVNEKSWGEDIMGKDTLPDGSTVNITFHNSTTACKFDLKVSYSDGSDASWSNLDLCTVSKVTLFWNSQTQQSTATVE